METTNQLFEANEAILKPLKSLYEHGAGFFVQLDQSQDTDDGIYENVEDWVKLMQLIDEGSAAEYLNFHSGKNTLEIQYDNFKLIRENNYTDEVKIIFNDPVTVQFATVNREPVTKEVKEITGKLCLSFAWLKNGRQTDYANILEVWLNCTEFF